MTCWYKRIETRKRLIVPHWELPTLNDLLIQKNWNFWTYFLSASGDTLNDLLIQKNWNFLTKHRLLSQWQLWMTCWYKRIETFRKLLHLDFRLSLNDLLIQKNWNLADTNLIVYLPITLNDLLIQKNWNLRQCLSICVVKKALNDLLIQKNWN